MNMGHMYFSRRAALARMQASVNHRIHRVPPFSPDPSKLDPDTAALYQQLLKDYGPYANMLGAFLPRPPALRHLFSYLVASRRMA